MYLTPPIAMSSANTDFVAVGAASAQFPNASMTVGTWWMYLANTASWIKQGANPTASAAAGSMFVPANTPVYLLGDFGAKLATIQDAAGGKASLVQVQR